MTTERVITWDQRMTSDLPLAGAVTPTTFCGWKHYWYLRACTAWTKDLYTVFFCSFYICNTTNKSAPSTLAVETFEQTVHGKYIIHNVCTSNQFCNFTGGCWGGCSHQWTDITKRSCALIYKKGEFYSTIGGTSAWQLHKTKCTWSWKRKVWSWINEVCETPIWVLT